MAHSKQAKKRIRQNEGRRLLNKSNASMMRSAFKQLMTAVQAGDKDAAQQALPHTGTLWGDPLGAVLVAGFLRLVVQWHATFSINSICHKFGTRPFCRQSSGRDSFWNSLITFGEGYHNFHHRFKADRLPVKQKEWVQLPSVTLELRECASGKRAASKTAEQGSIPCTSACCRRGSTEKGSAPVKRLMLVRIQSSALSSRWCNGQHRTLLRFWSWFDSRPGC